MEQRWIRIVYITTAVHSALITYALVRTLAAFPLGNLEFGMTIAGIFLPLLSLGNMLLLFRLIKQMQQKEVTPKSETSRLLIGLFVHALYLTINLFVFVTTMQQVIHLAKQFPAVLWGYAIPHVVLILSGSIILFLEFRLMKIQYLNSRKREKDLIESIGDTGKN